MNLEDISMKSWM